MISLASSSLKDNWELAGHRSAPLIANQSVAVIVGSGARATARVAIGLALEECQRRGVVIADMWGDLADLRALAPNADAHGVSDHYLFGISFHRLEHGVAGAGSLRVVSSGSDEVARREVFEWPRWELLFDRYRRSGELLIIVAREGQEGLDSLASLADTTLLVGDARGAGLPGVGGRIERTVPSMPPRAGVRSPVGVPRVGSEPRSTWRSEYRVPIALLMVIAVAGLVALSLSQYSSASSALARLASRLRGSRTIAAVPDSGPRAPIVANPRDSAAALPYAVEVAAINSSTGAAMRAEELRDIVGSTVTPMTGPDGQSWFVVFAGAFRRRESADSLQAELREMGVQLAEGDRVVQLPFALELATHLTPEAARLDVARYISLELPAYLLEQEDGTLTVYAGAFATREQSMLLSETCAGKGIASRLVYRTGR